MEYEFKCTMCKMYVPMKDIRQSMETHKKICVACADIEAFRLYYGGAKR